MWFYGIVIGLFDYMLCCHVDWFRCLGPLCEDDRAICRRIDHYLASFDCSQVWRNYDTFHTEHDEDARVAQQVEHLASLFV